MKKYLVVALLLCSSLFAEETLVMFKPTAVENGICGEMLDRLEKADLKLKGIKMIHLTFEEEEAFYQLGRSPARQSIEARIPFRIGYLSSGPVVVMVMEGEDAIYRTRDLVGLIRQDLGINIRRNMIHASDSVEAVEREIFFFFDEKEVF